MKVEQLIKQMSEEFDRVEFIMSETRSYVKKLRREVDELRAVCDTSGISPQPQPHTIGWAHLVSTRPEVATAEKAFLGLIWPLEFLFDQPFTAIFLCSQSPFFVIRLL